MILAVDVGSSRVKGALFSEDGSCHGVAVSELGTRVPEGELESEADPALWISALKEIASRLKASGEGGSRGLEAIVISGNGPTVLAVGPDGAPLCPALTWMDRRAWLEAGEASDAAGTAIPPAFLLPKALWFARHRPDIYAKAKAFLSCPEYLAMVLTGEAFAVIPEGYESFYGEPALIGKLGLDPGKFPPSIRPGTEAGVTTASGEKATGIARGTRVILTGPDYLAALVGTASTKPGRTCDRAGTSEGINLCAERPISDGRLVSVPHIVKPYTNLSGSISNSGKAVEWFLTASSGRPGTPGPAEYEAFFSQASLAGAGSGGLVFLPYLSGERAPIHDPAARGAFIGLGLRQGRPELCRAVLESTAFAIRDVLEVMEEAGASISELRAVGKPSRSPLWNRIKADVTGLPVLVTRQDEAELLGNACIAFAALGTYSGIAEAAESLVSIGASFEPDEGRYRIYSDLFGIYRESYRALAPLFPRMGRLGQGQVPED